MADAYEFTITIKRQVTFDDLEGWDSTTAEEAAAQEARWLNGKDGQGDYLDFALSEGLHTMDITFEKVEE